ncbi:protein FAM32A-like isoform X1 [Solea solea]|uniref:protein FAM32A-like isoform X1 n=1 Tax=Solea solea TaxID=90069 RepID=UPI002729E0AD|nr:protein FAM32A-like isoform X1 [Solea solea]
MTLKSQNMLVQTLKGVGNVLAGKGKKDKGSTLCLKQVVTSQNDEEAKTEKAGKRIPAQIAFEKMQAKRQVDHETKLQRHKDHVEGFNCRLDTLTESTMIFPRSAGPNRRGGNVHLLQLVLKTCT